MKILIITFTQGLNPGTMMQALGVKAAFTKLDPSAEIRFLKFPDFKDSGKIVVRGNRDSLLSTFKQKLYAAYRLCKYELYRRKNLLYTPAIDLFKYTEEDRAYIESFDLVVIGSDTILEQAYGSSNEIGLNWMPFNVKKIYFAASASPANFIPKQNLSEIASKAIFIGLRDLLTINFFRDKLNISKEKIVKQPDPSYYLDINEFILPKRLCSKIKTGKKHALYNFNSNFPYRKELANKLRSLGYTIVSTAYNPYADICFDTVDAFEWGGVFAKMDIIVTERFHDSVFGLRNCKPVIAIDWDKDRFASEGDSKTLRILEDYDLKALHFNLSISNDLTPICNAIRRIDELFDKNKTIEYNKLYISKANDILQKIKTDILSN